MKNFKCYLLKCISIGMIISFITVLGVVAFAEPEDENNENNESIIDIISSDDTTSLQEESNSNIDEPISEFIDDLSSEPYYEPESSQLESNESIYYSEPEQSYYEPESQVYPIEPSSEIEPVSSEDENSHMLIGGNSEIDTSEMTPDDWHFDYKQDIMTSQKTDFSDIKESQVSKEEQKDDGQWMLYLGVALIALSLGAIGFIIVRYVMFKKNNAQIQLENNSKLQNAKKLPKNSNNNKPNKKK